MPARKLPPRRADAMVELSELILAMQPSELQAFSEQLPPEDAQLLQRVMAEHHAAGWRADPASMAAHLDSNYRMRAFDRFLGKKWVELSTGVSKRQVWNCPGRIGKTRAIQNGYVWLLDKRPDSLSLYSAFGQQLADETGIAVRDMLRNHQGELRAELRQDRQQRKLFRTTEGGGLGVAGLEATIRGYGVGRGGVLGLDDPYKDWAEAHSEARRKWVVQQVLGTLRDRLDDENCGFLVCFQRVHSADLADYLKKAMEDGTGEAFEFVTLPALAVENDPLGREPGESIDPERFPVEAWQQRALAIGSYLTAAMLQQAPIAEQGNELRRDWFDLVDAGEVPPVAEQSVMSWDLKMKNTESGDYVVGQAWLRTGADYWLIDQLRGQYDHATTTNAIALMAVRHPTIRSHVVEAAGSHDVVLPELRKPVPDYVVSDDMAGRLGMTPEEALQVAALRRRGMSGLIPHPVTAGAKPVRARTFITPAAEAKNVHIVTASWTPHLLDEIAAFPGGAHDDQVDAMSQALQRLGVGTASITAPTRRAAPPTTAHQPSAPRAGVAPVSRLVAPSRRRR